MFSAIIGEWNSPKIMICYGDDILLAIFVCSNLVVVKGFVHFNMQIELGKEYVSKRPRPIAPPNKLLCHKLNFVVIQAMQNPRNNK